jgi:hypothetical protein
MSSFCDLSYRFVKDFDCVHNAFLKKIEFDGTLDCMWLSPNTKKWYMDDNLSTQKLGFDSMNV